MPEIRRAAQIEIRLARLATELGSIGHELRSDGWRVSAQQLRNAVHAIQDVERRLRNGDDWNG